MKRLGLISSWHDRKIGAGMEWKGKIDAHLNSAHIILLLISPDFLSSDYCYDIEMQRAMERHDSGEARVIPVILRPVDWTGALFDKLQALPSDSEPVTSKNWGSLDDAFCDVAKGVRRELENLKSVSIQRRPLLQTIVVDQMHRGDYASIAQAVEAANPGDCILVRHGLYQERILIDKPLEIIGEGERNEIELRAKDHNAITFKTSYGKVANLTLRQMSPGDFSCFDIWTGRLVVEECDISSQSSASVVIHKEADPRLRKNNITDCRGVGVFIVNGGQGFLEENNLLRNVTSILMKNSGKPVLKRNIMSLNEEEGIIICENSQGILEENEISNNGGIGVIIKGGSNPILRNNRIYDNKGRGIHITEDAKGILEGNDIFRNNGEIYIDGRCDPILRKNRVHDGKERGIDISNSRGLIEENDIFGNDGEIWVNAASNPTIERNQIHDSKRGGVYIWPQAGCTLENNKIFNNNYWGVNISANANPIVRHNQINNNGLAGISIDDGGFGTYEYNDLLNNKTGAWKISEDTKSKVKRFLNKE